MQLGDPLPLFQSVYQAMLLGFTPLFGSNNLPEIDLRLAVHVLTWIYERHTDEVAFCMETLKVIEVYILQYIFLSDLVVCPSVPNF